MHTILQLLCIFYSVSAIHVNVRNNEELKIDCILESGKLADELLFYSVKDGKTTCQLI